MSENKPLDDEPISLDDSEPVSLPPEDEPISLEDGPSEGMGALKAFGAAAASMKRKSNFNRDPNVTKTGAIRCRVWTSKISLAALQLMETQINEWLDKEEIEVKEVGHLVGTLQAKQPELHVIVFVWY